MKTMKAKPKSKVNGKKTVPTQLVRASKKKKKTKPNLTATGEVKKPTPRDRWRRGPNSLGPTGMPLWLEESWSSACAIANSVPAAERLWWLNFTDKEKELLGDNLTDAINTMGTIKMWQAIRGGTPLQAVVDIGIALGSLDRERGVRFLKHFGELPNGTASVKPTPIPEDVLDKDELFVEQTITTCPLVIHEGDRHVYWRGTRIPINWYVHDASWSFLSELARAARRGRVLEPEWRETNKGSQTVNNKARRYNLGELAGFPEELLTKIRPAGKQCYRLVLPSNQIGIIERRDIDRIVEGAN